MCLGFVSSLLVVLVVLFCVAGRVFVVGLGSCWLFLFVFLVGSVCCSCLVVLVVLVVVRVMFVFVSSLLLRSGKHCGFMYVRMPPAPLLASFGVLESLLRCGVFRSGPLGVCGAKTGPLNLFSTELNKTYYVIYVYIYITIL